MTKAGATVRKRLVRRGRPPAPKGTTHVRSERHPVPAPPVGDDAAPLSPLLDVASRPSDAGLEGVADDWPTVDAHEDQDEPVEPRRAKSRDPLLP
ncbi:MAG TPA: hypothetical protein VFX05_08545 [Casimicrobiaceae bacterium]|nr:hypothetical protein [Casimicrobiaceae bacterium]